MVLQIQSGPHELKLGERGHLCFSSLCTICEQMEMQLARVAVFSFYWAERQPSEPYTLITFAETIQQVKNSTWVVLDMCRSASSGRCTPEMFRASVSSAHLKKTDPPLTVHCLIGWSNPQNLSGK